MGVSHSGPSHPRSHVHVSGNVQLPLCWHSDAHTGTEQSWPVHPAAHAQVSGATHVPLLRHPRTTWSTHSPPSWNHRPPLPNGPAAAFSSYVIRARYATSVSWTKTPSSALCKSRSLLRSPGHVRLNSITHVPLVHSCPVVSQIPSLRWPRLVYR